MGVAPEKRRVFDIAVVGAGYVGLVHGSCLAAAGRAVTMVEVDEERRRVLQSGRVPIYEPGLDRLIQTALEAGNLRVTGDIAAALVDARIVIVAVGTPSAADGRADLSAVDAVVASVREHARAGTVLVIKSTVPPGTAVRLAGHLSGSPFRIPVVSCPEFLREGSAVEDLRSPSRVVLGGVDPAAIDRVAAVMGAPGIELVVTDNTSAELIKYGSNAFLALKISFINEIANVCELMGGDVDQVAHGMGLDPRIGRGFLNAGLGFGGSCFPKDVRALDQAAGRNGYSFWMLKTAIEVNEQQRARFVHKVRTAIGNNMHTRRIAVLGLAFKPGTDDLRHASSIDIIGSLIDLGAEVVAHDPVAMRKASMLVPPSVTFATDAYDAVKGADAVCVVTEWQQYVQLDWQQVRALVRRPIVIDGRNCLNRVRMGALGFNYYSVGRPPTVAAWDRRSADLQRGVA